MNTALEINNLRKCYKQFVLNDISFSLPKGYIMGLIGPNGAGKTTIIKLIMNLIRRDGGDIRVFGMDNIENEVEIKKRIGFVYDVAPFYQDVKLKHIAAGIAPFYPDWDHHIFQALVSEFALPLNKPVKKLSQGMQTKFSIALAFSHPADLILMDEPTTGLDPVFRRDLLSRLSGFIQDQEKAILFSTHLTTDLERTADYITFIRNGELVFSSTREAILDNFALVKGGDDLLEPSIQALFKSLRRGDYGVTGLTMDRLEAQRVLQNRAVVEKASLEDIMVFMNNGGHHDLENHVSRLAV